MLFVQFLNKNISKTPRLLVVDFVVLKKKLVIQANFTHPHPKLCGARNTMKIQQHNSVTIMI